MNHDIPEEKVDQQRSHYATEAAEIGLQKDVYFEQAVGVRALRQTIVRNSFENSKCQKDMKRNLQNAPNMFNKMVILNFDMAFRPKKKKNNQKTKLI